MQNYEQKREVKKKWKTKILWEKKLLIQNLSFFFLGAWWEVWGAALINPQQGWGTSGDKSAFVNFGDSDDNRTIALCSTWKSPKENVTLTIIPSWIQILTPKHRTYNRGILIPIDTPFCRYIFW
jgi:hypothetical protein